MTALHVCHACDLADRVCAGRCACRVDGSELVRHVAAGYCPHPSGPRFGSEAQPEGWASGSTFVLRPAEVPEGYTADQYKAEGCGCDGSQTTDGLAADANPNWNAPALAPAMDRPITPQ